MKTPDWTYFYYVSYKPNCVYLVDFTKKINISYKLNSKKHFEKIIIFTFQAIKSVGSSWPMASCHIIAIKLKWLILAEELLVFMGHTFIQRIVAIS